MCWASGFSCWVCLVLSIINLHGHSHHTNDTDSNQAQHNAEKKWSALEKKNPKTLDTYFAYWKRCRSSVSFWMRKASTDHRAAFCWVEKTMQIFWFFLSDEIKCTFTPFFRLGPTRCGVALFTWWYVPSTAAGPTGQMDGVLTSSPACSSQ